jgi:hypothetical protein
MSPQGNHVISDAGAEATEDVVSSDEHAATETTRAHKRIPSTERE